MKLDCKISLTKDDQKQSKNNFTDRCVMQIYLILCCIKIIKHDHVVTPFTFFRISYESCPDTCERECTPRNKNTRVCVPCVSTRSNFNFDAFCQINVDRVTSCHFC